MIPAIAASAADVLRYTRRVQRRPSSLEDVAYNSQATLNAITDVGVMETERLNIDANQRKIVARQ